MPLSQLEDKQVRFLSLEFHSHTDEVRLAKNLDGMKAFDAKNPWKEIEGTVRTVDESKVKDCTDDIDTLLVFVCL